MLLECVPELRGRAGVIARALLPGPYTLVLPNPARRYPLADRRRARTRSACACRSCPTRAQRVLDAVGCVARDERERPGRAGSRRRSTTCPQRIRGGCAAELDVGPLPGTPSTVIDFTGAEPYVIRDGAAPAAEAIARVRAALVA